MKKITFIITILIVYEIKNKEFEKFPGSKNELNELKEEMNDMLNMNKEQTDDILNKIEIHKKQIDNIVNNIKIHKKQNELYELIKLHNNQYSLGRGFLGIQIRTYIWLVTAGKLHISPADIENKSYEITDINTLDKKINELKNKKRSAFYKFLAYII